VRSFHKVYMKYEPLKEDAYYHIYNCGNNKENIFIEEKNYAYFLSLVKKHLSSVCTILGYFLLKNHFHLLIKTKENVEKKKISQSFSNLFNAYSKSINKQYNRSGSLFKDRFSRIKIEKEEYLINIIIYIHLNPVHHNFTDNFEAYKHSSFKALISDKSTSLDRDFVLNLYENGENLIYTHQHKQVKLLDKFLLE